MGEHTELPWCIPAGAQNGFIICAGDDPEKPGPILMIVSAPRGRSRVLTDAAINNNTAFMVKAAKCHDALVKALEEIGKLECGPISAAAIRAREALAKVSQS